MPKIGWSEQDKICVDMLATLNLGWIKVIVDLSGWIFCCKTAENSYFPVKKAIFWHPKMEKLPSEIALRQRRSVFLTSQRRKAWFVALYFVVIHKNVDNFVSIAEIQIRDSGLLVNFLSRIWYSFDWVDNFGR